MSIADTWLPEFDLEMKGTRRTLERIPNDKLDWRLHPKSNTIGWLAKHIADIPGYVIPTLTQPSLHFQPPGSPPPKPPEPPKSIEEVLSLFDKNAAAARETLAAAKDETFAEPWSLLFQGNVVFTQPKAGVLRSFVMSHLIHHRAILTVYLRMNDVPVPALYGPSGDENPFG